MYFPKYQTIWFKISRCLCTSQINFLLLVHMPQSKDKILYCVIAHTTSPSHYSLKMSVHFSPCAVEKVV